MLVLNGLSDILTGRGDFLRISRGFAVILLTLSFIFELPESRRCLPAILACTICWARTTRSAHV